MRGPGLARAAVVALALAAGGCAQSRVPEEQFYRLTPPPVAAGGGAALGGTLVVERLAADHLIAQRPLVYATGDGAGGELRQYHYHLWSDAPPRMIQEVIADSLRRAGAARMVVTPEYQADADYELAGKIKDLEYRITAPPRVLVALELGLTRVADARVLWVRHYRAERPVDGAGVAAAVAAMQDALAEIVRAVIADVGEE